MSYVDRDSIALLLFAVLMPLHVVRRTFGLAKVRRWRQKHPLADHAATPHPRHYPGMPLNYHALRFRYGAALTKA